MGSELENLASSYPALSLSLSLSTLADLLETPIHDWVFGLAGFIFFFLGSTRVSVMSHIIMAALIFINLGGGSISRTALRGKGITRS